MKSNDRDTSPKSLELLLPKMQTEMKSIDKISIKKNDSSLILAKKNDLWIIDNDTVARQDKVSQFIFDISEAKKLEMKTSSKEKFHFLHLDDISNPDSKAIEVVFSTPNGELQPIIIGKDASLNWDTRRAYVRINDTSWLTSNIDVSSFSTDKVEWMLDKINIPGKIKKISWDNGSLEHNGTAWISNNEKTFDKEVLREFIATINEIDIDAFSKVDKDNNTTKLFSVNTEQSSYAFLKYDEKTIRIESKDKETLFGKITAQWNLKISEDEMKGIEKTIIE